MASYWIDYCEQLQPELLKQVKKETFHNAERRQESILARGEWRALCWLAEHTPDRINSDHLTAMGFAAQLAAGAGYALASRSRYALLAVIGALVLNWLGDSLDGTLARYRQKQRPRYGFYVDHMVDSIGAVALLGGLALSGYMHLYIAVGLLIAFLLLSIQSYLATYTLGEFRLSFWSFGPTELRILLAAGNLTVFLRGPTAQVFGHSYRLFDLGGAVGLAGMGLMLLVWTAKNTCRLYKEERVQ
jgi:archaetidylinositol phosphate synthase